jgi:hypothetical protein
MFFAERHLTKFFVQQFKKNFIFFLFEGYLFYDLRIYVQNVCFISFTIYFIYHEKFIGKFQIKRIESEWF